MNRSWTNVHFSFSLPVEDRERLDEMMRARGTSLGLQFKRTLIECLHEAGVDPRHLDRPSGAEHRASLVEDNTYL